MKDSLNTFKEEPKKLNFVPDNNNPLISLVPLTLNNNEKTSNDKAVTVINSPIFINSEGNELLSSFRKFSNKVNS